jgi:hypothetical protein
MAGWVVDKRPLVTTASENDNGLPRTTKHVRLANHPGGRLYVYGGDWPNTIGYDSGVQTQYSVEPARWLPSGQSTGWRREFPYWPASGNAVPRHHDTSAVAWDSKRRVFWQIGGMSLGDGSDAPAGVISVQNRVMRFDPYAPLNSRWYSTGVPYKPAGGGSGSSEKYGEAIYDPVLDVCISGFPSSPGRIQIWDCYAQNWFGTAYFTNAELDVPRDGYSVTVAGFSAEERKLWLLRSDTVTTTKNLVAVALPNSRAELPAPGADVNWSSRAAPVWSNVNAHKTYISCRIEDGVTRKLLFWLCGTIGNDSQYPGQDIGHAGIGYHGHPSTNNATTSADTAVLVDLYSGREEYAQLPLPKFEDGQGWLLPFLAHYDSVNAILMYGTSAFEATLPESASKKIEANMFLARAKRVPTWVRNLPLFSWYQIPGSNCKTDLPSDLRNLISGAESSGGRGVLLNDSQNPWAFSGATLRRRDSVALFHGGGGGDGNGNMVLGFVLNAESPYWTVPMPPNPASQCESLGSGNTFEFNRNNRAFGPVAVHAYSSTHFIDAEDLWLRVGSQMVWPTDQGYFYGVHGFYWGETTRPYSDRLWALNLKPDVPKTGLYPNRAWCKHPWTEDIYGGSDSTLVKWTRAGNYWSAPIAASGLPSDAVHRGGLVIDPVANVLLIPRRPNADAYFGPAQAPLTIDLDTQSVVAGSWTGPATADLRITPTGYAWDDANECLWTVKAQEAGTIDSSFDLIRIRLVNKAAGTWSAEKVATATVNAKPDFGGVGPAEGKRLQYVPELGGLLLTLGYAKTAFFIRTSQKT